MKIKNLIVSLTIIGFMVAGTAFAVPNNSTNPAQTFESLSPKQVEHWTSLHDAHVKDTRPTRSELRAKRMELRALRTNAKVTPDYISDLTEDIVKLENRMEDATQKFVKISKEKFNLDFSSRRHGSGMSCPRNNGGHRGHYGMMNGHGSKGGQMSKGYHSQQHGYGNGMNAKTPEQKQSM